MFFPLSKLFWAFARPLTAIAVLMLLGLFLRLKWTRTGAALIYTGIAAFLLCGTLPIGHNLLVYLETRYERPDPMPGNVEGIIVLGGAINGYLSRVYHYPVTHGSVERLHDFLSLSRQYPKADRVVSGGSGYPGHPEYTEAPYAKRLLQEMGMDLTGVEFEGRSRNTYENATFSSQQVLPNPGERWLLVTSASHMPRSVAIFKNIGWEVIPYPTDHCTDGEYRLRPSLNMLQNFMDLDLALKEYIGTFVYYLSGKSALPFPYKIVGSSTQE